MTAADRGEGARLTELVDWQRRELDRLRSEAAARSVTDLARGTLMERYGCTAAEASQQLARLSAEAGISPAELAAEITGQHPPEVAAPRPAAASLARAAVEVAPDGPHIAAALLEEALSAEGAAAVAIWLIAPDGALELAGEAGFGPREASRWRRIPPGMPVPAVQAAWDNTETWWSRGRPAAVSTALIGQAGCARAVLPLTDRGASLGALEICWPGQRPEFSAQDRRQFTAFAEVTAQALAARPAGLPGAGHHLEAWIFGLLDGLHDSVLFAQAVRDGRDAVTGLIITWVSRHYRDPAGRAAADLPGHALLEMYPGAARSGGLYDQAIAVLASGEPQCLKDMTLGGGGPGLEIRIARLFDGVVISWRDTSDSERLAALLQQAQWLGQSGGWEENLTTGQVHWTAPALAIFGQPPGDPIPLARLHHRVPPADQPAVASFRDRLLRQHEPASAAFRILRADDGSIRQLRAFAQPVTGPAGELTAVRGAYQDISAQYHTRVAFDVTREQLASAQQRAAQEHQLAVRLQQAITPQASQPVEAAGLEVAARYRPAGPGHLVGGDWYDTALLPAKQVLLAVGDVAGHGLDAVTGMVALRNFLRGLAITGASPATLLRWLNSAACHLADGILATAVCGIYDPGRRTLRWARAGHLTPLLVRRGSARLLSPPSGMMLGLVPEATYQQATIRLRFGDTLLLFTDGLVERHDQPLDDSLATLTRLASQPIPDVSAFADHLITQTAANTGDDACLVAITIR